MYCITEENSKYLTNFQEIIDQKTLLKMKLKLLHIKAFEQDLKELIDCNFTILDLSLKDFQLNDAYQLIVPVKNRIIKGNDHLKLKSFLIYLSYIYQIDFYQIYFNCPRRLYHILFELNLPYPILQSTLNLLNNQDAVFFEEFLNELNHHDVRETILKTSRILQLKY